MVSQLTVAKPHYQCSSDLSSRSQTVAYGLETTCQILEFYKFLAETWVCCNIPLWALPKYCFWPGKTTAFIRP